MDRQVPGPRNIFLCSRPFAAPQPFALLNVGVGRRRALWKSANHLPASCAKVVTLVRIGCCPAACCLFTKGKVSKVLHLPRQQTTTLMVPTGTFVGTSTTMTAPTCKDACECWQRRA